MSFLGQVLPATDAEVLVADRVEVTDLMLRYMSAYDFGDVETFAASFTDPVLWDLTQTPACFTGGAADWEPTEFSRADFVAKAGPTPPPAADAPYPIRTQQHIVTNVIVTFTGADTAVAFAYLRHLTHVLDRNSDGQLVGTDSMMGGYYRNDISRVDGRWRISALRMIVQQYDPVALFAHVPPRPAHRP